MRLIGVEAGGEAIVRGRHAARFAGGSAGVLQGTRTFVLQDEDGNIELTHSISAGLDYAAVGPEHAWLRAHRPRRVRARHATTRRSTAFQTLARLEGILPALESAHAIAYAQRARAGARAVGDRAREPVRPRRQGRADGGETPGRRGRTAVENDVSHRDAFARLRSGARPGLVTYTTAGDPDLPRSAEILQALDRAGADVLEVGVPFSDPLADGPVIQRATERALAAGGSLRGGARRSSPRSAPHVAAPIVLFSYANPLLRMGVEAFAAGRRRPASTACWRSICRSRKRASFRATLRGGRARYDLSAEPDDDRRADSRRRRSSGAGSCTGSRGSASPGARDQVAVGRRGAGAADPRAHDAADRAGLRHLAARARGRGRRATPTRPSSAARSCR